MTDMPPGRRILNILWQICRAILACIIVAASLVVFPDHAPWLAAAWLLAFTLLAYFGRHEAIACLIACAVILIGKRLTPAPALLALATVMLAVAAVGIFQIYLNKARLSRRFACTHGDCPDYCVSKNGTVPFVGISAIVLWLAWGVMAYDWWSTSHCRRSVAMHPDRPVVCLGDSMTSLGVFGSYTNDLRRMISPPVVDMGRSGIAAHQVAEHDLPELAGHNPQVVVIELGAHDFLRGRTRSQTKKALETIIDSSRGMGAEVVLMEIPRSYMSDPFWGLEREIAREKDIELMPDTAMRMLLLRSPLIPPGSWLGEPYLTDESGIHPNAAGNRLLAESVALALERLWRRGGTVRKPASD